MLLVFWSDLLPFTPIYSHLVGFGRINSDLSRRLVAPKSERRRKHREDGSAGPRLGNFFPLLPIFRISKCPHYHSRPRRPSRPLHRFRPSRHFFRIPTSDL